MLKLLLSEFDIILTRFLGDGSTEKIKLTLSDNSAIVRKKDIPKALYNLSGGSSKFDKLFGGKGPNLKAEKILKGSLAQKEAMVCYYNFSISKSYAHVTEKGYNCRVTIFAIWPYHFEEMPRIQRIAAGVENYFYCRLTKWQIFRLKASRGTYMIDSNPFQFWSLILLGASPIIAAILNRLFQPELPLYIPRKILELLSK